MVQVEQWKESHAGTDGLASLIALVGDSPHVATWATFADSSCVASKR